MNKYNEKISENEINLAKEMIRFCALWIDNLWNDQAILENSESRKEIISKMKKEEKEYVSFIKDVNTLIIKKEYQEKDYLKLLAILGRHAYTREAYIRGLISFGEKKELVDFADFYRQQLPSLSADVNDINQRFSIFEKTKETKNVDEVYELCKHLPGIFLEQQHGINELLTQYKNDGGEI
jgi:hypothetical protein